MEKQDERIVITLLSLVATFLCLVIIHGYREQKAYKDAAERTKEIREFSEALSSLK